MERENIYKKLSTFDLRTPVEVTISFDDSDEDDLQPFNTTEKTDHDALSENFQSSRQFSHNADNNCNARNESNEPLVIKTDPDIIMIDDDDINSKTHSDINPVISNPSTANSTSIVQLNTDNNEQPYDKIHSALSPIISNPSTGDRTRTVQISSDNNKHPHDNTHSNLCPIISNSSTGNSTSTVQINSYSNEQPQKRKCEIPSNDEGTIEKRCCNKQETVHKSDFVPASEPDGRNNVTPCSIDNNEMIRKILFSESKCCTEFCMQSNESQSVPKTKTSNKRTKKVKHKDFVTVDPKTCFKNLLKCVSQNIIKIMNIHDSIQNEIITKQLGPTEIQQAWRRYHVQKYHLFYLSYSTIVNVVLPNSKNEDFIKGFLNDTYSILAVKDVVQHSKICYVFNEMLQWTVKRAFPKHSESATHKQLNNNPVSESQLPYMRQHQTVPQQPFCTPAGDAGGPYNTQMINNMNETVSQRSQLSYISSSREIQNTSLCNPYSPYICDSNCNVQHNHNKQIYSYGPPGKQISINVDPAVLSQAQQLDKQEYPKPLYGYDPQSGRVPNTDHQGDSKYMYQSEQRNDARTYQPLSQLPPHQSPGNLYEQLTTQIPRHVLPSNIEPPPYVQQLQPENTRSMSTDSGFISPVNLSITPAPTNDGDGSVQENSIPLITHVTSLNPKATLLPIGSCHVCQSATHHKCLGCLSVYYCGQTCQKADWQIHMTICNSAALHR